MLLKRLGLIGLATGMGLGLAGCVDDGYGYGGVGYASDGYYGDGGYGGGYGSGYYGAGYDGYGYGDPYGYGGGYGSYFGWYGDYYYPGSGVYVYDRNRRPRRWNEGQQRYWQNRQQYRGERGGNGANWQGFGQHGRGNNQGFQGNRGQGNPAFQGNRGQGYRGFQGNRGQGNPAFQGNRGNGYQGYRGNGDAAAAAGFRGRPGGTANQFRGGQIQGQVQAAPQALQGTATVQPGAGQGYRGGGLRFGGGNRGGGGQRGGGGHGGGNRGHD